MEDSLMAKWGDLIEELYGIMPADLPWAPDPGTKRMWAAMIEKAVSVNQEQQRGCRPTGGDQKNGPADVAQRLR